MQGGHLIRPLFRPAGPPSPTWRHFETREAADAFCAARWPANLEAITAPINVKFDIRREGIPGLYPRALEVFARVFAKVVALCPRRFYVDPAKKGQGKGQIEPPAVVRAAAADAAFAALQLYVAVRERHLVYERRAKWEPFALGFGCLGYYGGQPVTYDPPEELLEAADPLPIQPVTVQPGFAF